MSEKKDYAAELKEGYQTWNTIWNKGWSDPSYADGEGLHGARNRIIYNKRELEKAGGELPEEYDWPLPPEVPRDYMARAKELWYHGIQTYQKYLDDENYQYLCKVQESLPKTIRKQSCIDNVIGYANWLRHALEHKDFLTLRNHENPERYFESFQQCRNRINTLLAKSQESMKQSTGNEQMNLFQWGMRQAESRRR